LAVLEGVIGEEGEMRVEWVRRVLRGREGRWGVLQVARED
jgi:hypothetical protein